MRPSLLLSFTLLIGACSNAPTIPRSDPLIRGSIRSMGDLRSIAVVAGTDSLSCDVRRRAQVRVGDAAVMRRSGRATTAAELQVGTVVSVWTTGVALDMCPGIVTATAVVVEDR